MIKDLTPYGGGNDGGDGMSPFDEIRQLRDDGTEFWSARDLMPLLEYTTWHTFICVIERAMVSCKNAKQQVGANFTEVRKVGVPGKMASVDFEVSRYGGYLIAMCGDVHKSAVAAAHAYFTERTRQAELAEEAILRADPMDLVIQQSQQIIALANRLKQQERIVAEASQRAVESSLISQEALTKAEEAMTQTRIIADQMNTAAQELANVTARKFVSTRKLVVNKDFIRRLGKEATRICIDRGIERTEIPHAEYGCVGTYPEGILDEAYQNLITGEDAGLW